MHSRCLVPPPATLVFIGGQAPAGLQVCNRERIEHGLPLLSLLAYPHSPHFGRRARMGDPDRVWALPCYVPGPFSASSRCVRWA